MKVLKRDLRGNKGELKLVCESLDDLWHLKYIIDKKDLVFALTYRAIDGATDKLRSSKLPKKPVYLGIIVEEVDFHKFSNRLRVHGIIEEGVDIGSHHTLNVETGTDLSIIKNWTRDQLERIKEAVDASNQPQVIIVTIEDGEAIVGVLRQYGVEESFSIRATGGKDDLQRSNFFKDVSEQLNNVSESVQAIVIAGPGFIKEDFFKFFLGLYPKTAKKCILDSTSSIGVSGFQEVLRRGTIDKIANEMRISKEAKLIEELSEEIAKDGKAAYGYEEVKNALELGAIETMMILDETLRNFRYSDIDIDKFLINVEKARGKIIIFSSEFEPGKRLKALGGLAAILRFKVG